MIGTEVLRCWGGKVGGWYSEVRRVAREDLDSPAARINNRHHTIQFLALEVQL